MIKSSWMIAGCVAVAGLMFLLKRQRLTEKEDIQQISSLKKYILVDVRTPHEFQSRHIKGAKNISVTTITKYIAEEVPNKTQPVLLYCHSGARSGMAMKILKQQGYTQLFNLGSYSRAERMMEKLAVTKDQHPAGTPIASHD